VLLGEEMPSEVYYYYYDYYYYRHTITVCLCAYSSDAPVKSPTGSSVNSLGVSVIDDDDDNNSDDAVSIEGYGDVDVGKYNEDGSFVGAYANEASSAPPPAERQRGRNASQPNAYV